MWGDVLCGEFSAEAILSKYCRTLSWDGMSGDGLAQERQDD